MFLTNASALAAGLQQSNLHWMAGKTNPLARAPIIGGSWTTALQTRAAAKTVRASNSPSRRSADVQSRHDARPLKRASTERTGTKNRAAPLVIGSRLPKTP